MYNRFRELPHNYISFQKIDRKGGRYAYQKKPVNMVYSYINEQNKKAVEGAASAAAERNILFSSYLGRK